MDKEYVAKYYDETLPYYSRFWHRDGESNALHYGFWDKETKSLGEALLNENRFLAEMAKIQSIDKVLDAGCGVGGSAIWLARHVGAKIVGITVSPKQVEVAKLFAEKARVNQKVEFEKRDFLASGFGGESFDVVWAIESVCHAENKIDFLKEAYRILRKGGRLIVADGFLKRQPLSSEANVYRKFLTGLVLPNLSQFSEFEKWMQEAGFVNIKFLDKTDQIRKSSKILYQRCLVAYPFFKIANVFGLIPDIVMKNGPAGIAQYKIVQSGLAGYGIFYGEK